MVDNTLAQHHIYFIDQMAYIGSITDACDIHVYIHHMQQLILTDIGHRAFYLISASSASAICGQ